MIPAKAILVCLRISKPECHATQKQDLDSTSSVIMSRWAKCWENFSTDICQEPPMNVRQPKEKNLIASF